MPATAAPELLAGKGFVGTVTSPPKQMTLVTLFAPPFFRLPNHILKAKEGKVVLGAACWHQAERDPQLWL